MRVDTKYLCRTNIHYCFLLFIIQILHFLIKNNLRLYLECRNTNRIPFRVHFTNTFLCFTFEVNLLSLWEFNDRNTDFSAKTVIIRKDRVDFNWADCIIIWITISFTYIKRCNFQNFIRRIMYLKNKMNRTSITFTLTIAIPDIVVVIDCSRI